MRAKAILAVLACGLSLAGCGSDQGAAPATATPPTAAHSLGTSMAFRVVVDIAH